MRKRRSHYAVWIMMVSIITTAYSGHVNRDLASPSVRKTAMDRSNARAVTVQNGGAIMGTLFNLDPEDFKSAYVLARAVEPDPTVEYDDSLTWKGVSSLNR